MFAFSSCHTVPLIKSCPYSNFASACTATPSEQVRKAAKTRHKDMLHMSIPDASDQWSPFELAEVSRTNVSSGDLFPNDLRHAREDIAQPPGAAGGTGGSDSDGGDDDHATLLQRYGRADEVLPDDICHLPAADLVAYLEATRNGFVRWLARIWPGWRRRVAADPDFPFKVLMEETVGLGLAASGMIAARGKDILNELDFAFCDIAVGGTLNFILVYLLTPAVVVGGATQSGFLAGMGRMVKNLPANAFSAGTYTANQRFMGFMYKGGLFAVCGFGGSLLGTTLSQILVLVRRAVSGNEGAANKELPNVAVNSLAWAGFMFLSSNPRYQTVAGVERALFAFAPDAFAKAGSGALRTANNVLGGANWVWWARAIGLQEKPTEEKEDSSSDS
eukprot:GFKZ01008040.1.p1 GENE.GFKZ01008040.1~~GFKZ01008040.1.p1  ORF type:complete len:390 (-),score=51.61 GFKZ01008040.1:1295-2464(-)